MATVNQLYSALLRFKTDSTVRLPANYLNRQIEKYQSWLKADAANSRYLLELVERMLIYKFSTYSRQELEVMFGLTEWRQTRFYQEVEEETKLETIPRLLKMGLSVEQIAEALELKIEVVRQAIKQQGRKES